MSNEFKLKQEQKDAILHIVNNYKTLVRAPTGFGKTIVALFALKLLRDKGLVKKALIIGKPKEIDAFRNPVNNRYRLSYQALTTSKEFESYNTVQFGNTAMLLVSSSLLTKFPQKLQQLVNQADFVVIDELHNYHVHTSKVTMLLRNVFRRYKGYFVGMTATPFYKQLEDIFALMSIMVPGLFPSWDWFWDNFVVYEERVIGAAVKNYSAAGVTRSKTTRVIKDKLGYKNETKLHEMLKPYVYYTDASRFKIVPKIETYYMTNSEGVEYNRMINGIGLDTLYRIVLRMESGEEKIIQRTKTENLWLLDRKEISPASLQRGQWVLFNEQRASVLFVKESDSVGDYLKRLLTVQLYLSDTAGKFEAMKKLIRPGFGALVYFSYKKSIEAVKTRLLREYPNRRIVVVTGDTSDVPRVLQSLTATDIVLISKVATQSLNFYYQDVIVFEQITTPGLLEQFVGRCTREDAAFSEVNLHFIIGDNTAEEYFYQRVVFLTNASPGARLQNRLPAIPRFQGINFDNGTVSFRDLKDTLLWRK